MIFKNKKIVLIVSTIITAFILLFLIQNDFLNLISTKPTYEEFVQTAYKNLIEVRSKKKTKIKDLFKSLTKTAEHITDDPIMNKAFFHLMSHPHDSKMEQEVDQQFVKNYGKFYDILFVNKKGYIFNTIKKESDCFQNFKIGNLSNSEILKLLNSSKTTKFLDYKFYAPSNEHGMFIVVPYKKQGWYIFQVATNDLENILADTMTGRTGETYIVSRNNILVTQSRFFPHDNQQKIIINTYAAKQALKNKNGAITTTDYRGIKVLSAFDSISFGGLNWALLSEQDEAEVITDYYKLYKNKFLKEISNIHSSKISTKKHSDPTPSKKLRVDVNEFARTKTDKTIFSVGISTCTAIYAVLPDKIAYLSHVSPTSVIYKQKNINTNDRLSTMINQLFNFDVYPSQISKLKFVIIATHKKSIEKAIDILTNKNIELSQIRFAYNSDAITANVYSINNNDELLIEWISKAGTKTFSNSNNILPLSSIFKRVASN